MRRMLSCPAILLAAFLSLSDCSRDVLHSSTSGPGHASPVSPSGLAAKQLLNDPWFDHFNREKDRKPVLELIQTKLSANLGSRWFAFPAASPRALSIKQFETSLLESFPQNFKIALLESGKIRLVTTRIRTITHLERYFQMRHASPDSLKEPGHLRGADYAVVITPSVTMPVYQRTGFMVVASWSVSFSLQLVELASDTEVWDGQVQFFYNGPTGNFDGRISSSTPRSGITRLRVVHNQWVALDTLR